MKIASKYMILIGLLGAYTVQAQTPPAKPLPLAQAKLRAEEIKAEIQEDHRHVLHLQARARKEKDVIKLTCINDKLVQLKAQMNIADTLSVEIEASSGDDAPRLTDLEATSTAVKKLRGEADGCAGELEMYKQESRTDVDRPDLPDDPTEGGPFDPNMGSEVDVPGFATPYR